MINNFCHLRNWREIFTLYKHVIGIIEIMNDSTKKYTTHWHSFWFGFMCALAAVLAVLLVFTITDRISFKHSSAKKTSISKDAPQETSETPQGRSLEDLAASLEIDQEEFQKCMDEDRFAETVQNNIDSGTKAGVKGTPHSFVLIDDAIYEIPGAYSEEGMREFFDDLLAGNDPRATDISDTTDLDPLNEDDWIRGEEDARITVIEYSDIDCPFCKKFHTATTNMMVDYADDVRWAFRHMPVDALHPRAREKAEATECAGDIGGGVVFWTYLDRIFEQ